MKLSNHGAAGGLVLGSLSAAGGAFVVNILSARMLGPELRGSVAQVLQLSYFLSPLLLMGVDKRILRSGRFATPKDAAPSSSVLIVMVLATPVCFLVAGNGGLLAIPVSVVAVMFAYSRSWNVARGSTRSYVVPFVCYQLTIVLGSFVLFLLGVTSWVSWTVVYIFPGVLIALWNIRRLLWWSSRPLVQFASTLKQNGNYMLASVSVITTTRFERVLLPVAANPGELGLYIVVATASEPLFWFAQALSDIRVGAGKTKAFSKRAIVIDCILFSGVGALGGFALHALLVPVFGVEYENAKVLIPPLMVASIILAIYRQLAGRVLLGHSSRAIASAETITAVFAIVIYSACLLVFQSALAAAWGSVGVYVTAIVVLIVFMVRRSRGLDQTVVV